MSNIFLKNTKLLRNKKLRNTQLQDNNSKTGIISNINQKNFHNKERPHESFLTRRQTTKIRNAFSNNISRDKKLIQAHMSKITQSGGSFASWLGNLGKKSTNTCCYSFSDR